MSMVQLFCAVFLVHVCSALASEKESFFVQNDEKTTTCGLDDFQMDTLAKADYWSVPFALEPMDNCFIPDGYERPHISSCQLHFSVCGSLPEGVCDGHPDTAACQEVVTFDGLRHYYSIGESQESYKFKPNGHPTSDGFFTIRHGHTIGHHTSWSCRGSFKILLKFVCDRDRVWDPLSHDTATYVRDIVIINHCYLEIEFGYSGACHGQIVAPTLAASTLAPAKNSCSLSPYNLTGLSRYDYWFAEVPTNLCYSNDVDIVQTCNFTFAFCETLPDQKTRLSCSGAAVCQDGVVDDEFFRYKAHFSYSMGQFTGFSYNNELAGGGFLMNAANGFWNPNFRCKIMTTIVLVCNSSAVWSSQDLTKIFSAKQLSPCEYQFVLPYSGACLPVFPNATVTSSTAHPTMTTPTKINTTTIHPHPTTSTKPSPSPSPSKNSTSSHHHGPTNSTSSKHPSSTPTRNSTATRPTSTSHHNSTATKHPPSTSTPTKNSTSSSRHAGTSTASFSPTTAPHVVTTNPTPTNPDRRLILGLTAGVIVFAVLSIVLLVMVIIAVQIFIKKRRKLKFVKLDSQK